MLCCLKATYSRNFETEVRFQYGVQHAIWFPALVCIFRTPFLEAAIESKQYWRIVYTEIDLWAVRYKFLHSFTAGKKARL